MPDLQLYSSDLNLLLSVEDTAVFPTPKVFNSDNFSIASFLLTRNTQVTFAKNLQMKINIKMDF